jgi:peptidoglycan-associated lipoprotein
VSAGANAGGASAGAGVSAGAKAGNPSAGASANLSASGDATMQAKEIPSVDLLFETDSANLTSSARSQLMQLATWAKCTPKGALILEGHADPRGTQAHNLKLSGDRAAIVRQKLIEMGVPSDRVVVTIYGENGPRRPTFAEQRRVTVRATARPIQPADITASR